MYYQVASKLAVTAGTSTEAYSQAVSMAGANGCQVESTIFNLGGATSLTVHVQEGNDLENWSNVSSSAAISSVGATTFKAPNVSSQYVRLRYVGVGTGNIIVAAGVNTVNL